MAIDGNPQTLYWDGLPGKWVIVTKFKRKRFQTFMLTFCPKGD